MVKKRTSYLCNACGHETNKYMGRCYNCGEFNTYVEVEYDKVGTKSVAKSVLDNVPLKLSEVESLDDAKTSTGIDELDRVFSGGIVDGSLILVGGDPGVGKSTLLLQVTDNFNKTVLYISGEESLNQIKLRATRLGVKGENLLLLSETNLDILEPKILEIKPSFVVIDSIQTLYCDDVNSTAGSVSQTRECVHRLMKLAKGHNITIFIIGHVTKEGMIAGPKMLEHMVDTVIYFEGEKNASFRIIRAVKNRFGGTNEIGVFEMGEKGLVGIDNPSRFMLSDRPSNVAGSVVTCSLEGSRPILTEVQALVSKSNFGNPRRSSTGVDLNRVVMLMAVLEKRVGLALNELDSYVNIVGGLKVNDTSIDSAIICAIASSYKNRVVNPYVITFGEVGLTGELRNASNVEKRIVEAKKLGFKKCVIPLSSYEGIDFAKKDFDGIEVKGVSNARDLIIEVLT
ncbi:MAG: DNA repair protein RadA [Lachnospirales bacterium]